MLLDDKRDLQLERTLAADVAVLPSKGKTVAAEDKAQRVECDYLIAGKWPKVNRKRYLIDIYTWLECFKSHADIYKTEKITTLAGATKGFADGDGDQAKFQYPHDICWNPHDKCLYVCDSVNKAIRRITLQGSFVFCFRLLLHWLTDVWSGQVSTLAHEGLLSGPSGIAMHYRTNTFFVTNCGSHSVCKITASGNKPICFSFSSFFFSFFFFFFSFLIYCLRIDECSCWEWQTRESGWTWNEYSFRFSLRHSNWSTNRRHIRFRGSFNSKDHPPRYEHSCYYEWWNRWVFFLCVDVYMLLILMSQCSYHVIKGEVSTLAGSADKGDANGNGNGARFNTPLGLWFDEKHQSLLVCDFGNGKLKRVSLKGVLNIAISFFSARHLHHTSSSFHLILLSSSSSWLKINNRRCIDSVWHTSSKICDNCKHSYPRLNSAWQNLPSLWSR